MDMQTDTLHAFTSDIAFTPTVKAIQTRLGSRRTYQRQEENGSWAAEIPRARRDAGRSPASQRRSVDRKTECI